MYITHLKYNGFPHLRAPHKNRQRSTSGISLVYLKSTKRSRWIIFKTNREHLLGSTFKWLMVVSGWVCFYFSVFFFFYLITIVFGNHLDNLFSGFSKEWWKWPAASKRSHTQSTQLWIRMSIFLYFIFFSI